LDDVLREVLSANPALVRSSTLVAAQRAHVAQVGVLPDPTVTLSWMGDPVPFKVMDNDPSSYRGLSVMQMIPLGGKRGLQREVARRDVAVEEVSASAVRRNLLSEARAAYFDYAYYDQALKITERNHQRLSQLAEITESRYRVGKAMQQDVLRARLEISMLLQRTAALQQQRLTAAARLNALMGRTAGAPLAVAAEQPLTALPAIESLKPVAEANDLMLSREARMGDREKAALALSRKNGIPDLSVGYMYQQRTGLPDMHGMQFTVNLPGLHRERLQQEIAEGQLRVRASEQGQQARRLEVSYELQQASAAALTARQMLDLYDQAILPQAQLARDSAQASYTVGNVDFLTVLTSYTAIYSYELDYHRQRADYEIAIARIYGLTGDLDAPTAPEAH
jgi:outer membrane protein TolC